MRSISSMTVAYCQQNIVSVYTVNIASFLRIKRSRGCPNMNLSVFAALLSKRAQVDRALDKGFKRLPTATQFGNSTYL